jgi:hypothetical protein
MQENIEKTEPQEEEGQVIEINDAEEKEEKVEAEAIKETIVEEPKQEDTDADDLSQYSESVKKRITKLTKKYREEERERQAAVEFAESVKKQNEELKEKIAKLDSTYVGEFDTRVQSQSVAAKEAYRKAYEAGDADAMYEAQQAISRIALEEARLNQLKEQREEAAKKVEANGSGAAPATVPNYPAPPPPKPDPKAEEWAKRNEWFGQDQTMTYAAFGIHKTLIEEEGIDPNSEEYYTELDTRIKTEFPHKFGDIKKSSGPRVASAGATASKTASQKGRRTVKLTPSQIAIAKRLNVPLEEYAKYVKE